MITVDDPLIRKGGSIDSCEYVIKWTNLPVEGQFEMYVRFTWTDMIGERERASPLFGGDRSSETE